MHTFNPVYVENPLKNSNYIEVTSMIRAAAKNFSGKAKESPIWEDSAFNLTKNIVVYCAAILDYFTLIDCYETMLKADSKEIIDNFLQKLEDKPDSIVGLRNKELDEIVILIPDFEQFWENFWTR